MIIEGKGPLEIDEELRKRTSLGKPNPSSDPPAQSSQNYSLVNIVFNYFNDSS